MLHPGEDLVGVVNTSTHFEEEANISLGEFAILDENLGAHHEFESNLITLEETSVDIPVNSVGKALSDVVDSVFDEVRFWRVINTIIEEGKELLKRGVVHPVDVCHLYNAEVEHGTSSSNGSEVFSLLIDLDCLFSCLLELLIDFLRFDLDLTEDVNKFNILKKRTLGVCELIKKQVLIVLQSLCVHCYFFL